MSPYSNTVLGYGAIVLFRTTFGEGPVSALPRTRFQDEFNVQLNTICSVSDVLRIQSICEDGPVCLVANLGVEASGPLKLRWGWLEVFF